MTEAEIKALITAQLPQIIAEDSEIRDFIIRTVSNYYAPKDETQDRFNQIMEELRRNREEDHLKWAEQARKWQEQDRRWQESDRRWTEQARRWQESDRKFDQVLAEIKSMNKKYDSTIGALGSRWGLYSEASFRNALKGILEDSFGVEVLNINEYDDEGEVFGRPDQIELDIIIKNGLLIICEIKSSMSKSDMYSFDRKVSFYEKRHQRQANRKLVISPMIDDRAKPVAEDLGIEIYSYADSVEL